METTERRAEPRFEVYCPTEVAADGMRPLPGVTRNVSTTGVLLMTHQSLPIGQDLEFVMLVDDRKRLAVSGRVVRQTELDDETFWNFQTAVELTAAVPALREPVAALAARDATMFS